VALRRRQQKNFSIGIADEIQIADDLERLGGAGQVRNLAADLDRLGGIKTAMDNARRVIEKPLVELISRILETGQRRIGSDQCSILNSCPIRIGN